MDYELNLYILEFKNGNVIVIDPFKILTHLLFKYNYYIV